MSLIDIAAISFSEIFGDFGFKEFANKGGLHSFLQGIIGYGFVIYFLIRSLQGSSIILVNTAWDGLSTLFSGLSAMVLLGERFDSPYQYIGFVFIIIGLFLLKMPVFRKNEFKLPNLFTS
jgi:multidrug transporter EmrE-like cation transporter